MHVSTRDDHVGTRPALKKESALSVLAITAAVLAACGPSGPIVVIHVSGDSSAATAFKLSIDLNERPAAQVETFSSSANELNLQLPDDSLGQLKLHLDAVNCHDCTMARAMATQLVVNANRYDLDMALTALPGPVCPSGSLLSPRWFYDPVLLDSGPRAGQVYLATGADLTAPGSVTQKTEVYDPSTLTSRPSQPLLGVGAHPVRLLDGRVLIAGGYDGNVNQYVDMTQLYDPVRDEVRLGKRLNRVRSGHATVVLADGKVLTLGGKTEPPRLETATAELYDPITDQWTDVDSMAESRVYVSAVLLPNGKVLVSGGNNAADNYPRALEVFNPTASRGSQWTSPGNLLQGRWNHASFVLPDHRVLIVGGSVGDVRLETAEILEVSDSSVTSTPVPAAPHSFANATFTALRSGAVLAAGGGNGVATTNTQIFNPTNGRFEAGPPLLQSRADHNAILLRDGSVLLLNGVTGAIIRDANASTLLSTERIYFDACP